MNKLAPVVAHHGYVSAANIDIGLVASAPQGWMRMPSALRPVSSVNANQLTSLSAMIAYTAARSGQSEYRIERDLSDRFNVPNAKVLPANDFDDAIRYLADILPA